MSKPTKSPDPDRPALSSPLLEATLDLWTQAGGRRFIPISGRSMQPLIQSGDHVLVEHGCPTLHPGDIVVFRHRGILIAHRIIRIEAGQSGPMLTTKGDNVPYFDPPLTPDNVIGRVLMIERGNHRLSLDRPIWRGIGWGVAQITLAWATGYRWGRGLKRGILGARSPRWVRGLRRSGPAFFSTILALVQLTGWRRTGNDQQEEEDR